MRKDMEDKIIAVVNREIGQDIRQIGFDTNLREQAYLDSMQFVAICAGVEKNLGIDLPVEVMGVNSFNQFLDVVAREVARVSVV